MRGDMAFVIPGHESLTVEFKSAHKRLLYAEFVEAVVNVNVSSVELGSEGK